MKGKNKIVLKNDFNANLNDGKGDPCAGQVRATDMPIRSSNATRFIFDENLGRLLPTGSEIGKVLHDKNNPGIYYLKAGNGDPCAGHVNANGCEAFSWYAARFDFEENFGRELPTGSTNDIRLMRFLVKGENHTMQEM